MPSVCKLGHVQIPTVAYCLEREKASEGYKSSGPSVNSVVYWSSLVFEGVLNFASSFERGNPIMSMGSIPMPRSGRSPLRGVNLVDTLPASIVVI